jgi:hypothetical protein
MKELLILFEILFQRDSSNFLINFYLKSKVQARFTLYDSNTELQFPANLIFMSLISPWLSI